MKFKFNFKIPVALKNQTFVGIACVVAALVVGFVFVPLVNNMVSATTAVVRAKQDIPEGTQITASMLETVQVGKQNLPSGIVKKASNVAGKYAAVDISVHDMITASKTSSTGGIYNLSNGQYLISVTVKNFADGLSGKIQSGDVVKVLLPPSSTNSISSSSESNEADCPAELQYVKVAAVTASNGTDTNEATVQKSSGTSTNSNLPATVTLIVNDRQAQILAGQESNTVHLALACRSGKKAEELLKKQADYFEESDASLSLTSSSSAATSSSSAKDSTSSAPSSSSLDTSASLGVAK